MSSGTAKQALRKSVRTTLKALSETGTAEASQRACMRAVGLAVVQASSAVSVYLAMPKGECLTTSLLRELFDNGKVVYVPRVDGPGREDMRMLRVDSMAQLDGFPRSKWGIPEPTVEEAAAMEDGSESAAIDLVIVPAVAFDARCRRLGQGRGYYDTFLERLTAARKVQGLPAPVTVGLGLQEQLVDEVPVDPHDVPLDFVCLPDVTLKAELDE